MFFIFTLFGEMILFDQYDSDKFRPPTSFEYQLEWIFTKYSASFIKRHWMYHSFPVTVEGRVVYVRIPYLQKKHMINPGDWNI